MNRSRAGALALVPQAFDTMTSQRATEILDVLGVAYLG